MRKGLRVVGSCLAWAAVACADDDGLQDCEDLQIETCDILDESCQAFVYRLTGCVRGADRQDPPPVDVLTVSEFEDLLRADLDDRTDEEARLDGQYAALFRAIRFLPEGQDSTDEAGIETLARRVAAFYSSDTKAVTIIDREGSEDPERDVFVLAHEFVHAQQDIDVGLAEFKQQFATSSDGSIRTRSVIEGEAVLYSNLVMAREPGVAPTRADFDEYFASWQAGVLELGADPLEPYDAVTLSFPYPFGGAYVADAWFDGEHPNVLALYDAPPASTAAVMAGADGSPPEGTELPSFEPSLPAGYSSTEDRLGALLVYVLFARNGAAPDDASRMAERWVGDRLDVITSDAGEGAAMRWTIAFDDPEVAVAAADVLATVQPVAPGGWRATVQDSALELVVVDDSERLTAFASLFEAAPVRDDAQSKAEGEEHRALRTPRARRTAARVYDLHAHAHRHIR